MSTEKLFNNLPQPTSQHQKKDHYHFNDGRHGFEQGHVI
jgi:hypothetical protein